MKELKGTGKNGRGHHTWTFMVGYVYKNRGTQGYREFSRGISKEEADLGVQEYVKYGAANKNCVCLTPYNIFERAANFGVYKLRPAAGRNEWSLAEVVMAMLQSKNYMLASAWAR